MSFEEIVGVNEFEALAKANVEGGAWAYFSGGAGEEVTMQANVSAFGRRRLRPRVLVDLTGLDPATEMLGREVALPVAIGPLAGQRLAHPQGEVAVARAAAAAGVLMAVSTYSSCSMEEVAAAAGPRWFQLYLQNDRGVTEELVERAGAAGYEAIVLTADLPVVGYKERELRTPVVESADAAPGNFPKEAPERRADRADYMTVPLTGPGYTWDVLEWLHDKSGLPVVVKGVLTTEDARLAVEHGAAGIIVSNHGGRQLDYSPPAIDVLEEVVDAAEGRAEIFLDSGVRRGVDVLVALGLGASAVFIGRPYLWGLAAGGEEGVARVLEIFRTEIVNAMALLGVRSPAEVTRVHVL